MKYNIKISFKNLTKLFIGIIISLFIIFTLYSRLDLNQLKIAIRDTNSIYLFFALLITFFIGLISSFRFTFFARKFGILPYPKVITSFKSYFVVSCFNLILPSKLGDLSKGFICERLDKRKYPNSIHIFTLYEKISDLFAIISIFLLFSICLNTSDTNSLSNLIEKKLIFQIRFIYFFLVIFFILFTFLSPSFKYILRKFKKINKKSRFREFINFYSNLSIIYFINYQIYSIMLWIIQILQMLIFGLAVGINLFSVYGVMALIVSTLVGLLPISFAGIGTRDATLLFLLSSRFDNPNILILGFLLSTRYLVPSLIGLYYSRNLSNYAFKA